MCKHDTQEGSNHIMLHIGTAAPMNE